MSTLSVRHLGKSFGGAPVIRDISFTVGRGELMALLGPSGCGKTTTLRMIAGLTSPDSGEIHIGDKDVTRLAAYERPTSLVFQNYALFPHMTVAENVAFGLRMHGVARSEAADRAGSMLALVAMAEFAKRYPRQLSGGQQQRVALARSLALQPSVLLLDEPLSNLDANLREQMRVELRQLHLRLELTTVFVTHDQEEALSMSDRIIVMRDGAIEQDGTPVDVFNRPRTEFVARFIGSANTLPGTWDADGWFRTDGGLRIRTTALAYGDPGSRGVIAIRPENIEIAAPSSVPRADESDRNAARGEIEFTSYRGSFLECGVRLESGDLMHARIAVFGSDPPRFTRGANVTVLWETRNSIPTSPEAQTMATS